MPMRVCPECGHIDRTMWRQNKWRTNVDFIKVEDYPEDVPPEVLVSYNLRHKYCNDNKKNYGHRLCQEQNIIERILFEEVLAYGVKAFHTPRENPKHYVDHGQTQLTEWWIEGVRLNGGA